MAIKLFQKEYFVLDLKTEHSEKNPYPKVSGCSCE
jgi:hypothetical protein